MNIKKITDQMTLAEKAALISGKDAWSTVAVERLGIPSLAMMDGPHGLRTDTATCFPTASCVANSFNRETAYLIGQAVGRECRHSGVHINLGPGLNIKRSPLCGRNFEYYSEDPVLSGEMAAAHINGIQSTGVGACAKHFALNNQEYRRMTSNSIADMRTMHEIYLKAFEIVVKKSKPKAIMGSYNRINGIYSCENKWLLTDILRKKWGFDGIVISDWGAANLPVESIKAGLDLEMPSSYGITPSIVIEAVKNGKLKESVLNKAVERIIKTALELYKPKEIKSEIFTEHSKLARITAADCLTLLKNEEGLLPLKNKGKLAVIGQFAVKPHFQGGGSSNVKAFEILEPLTELKKLLPAADIKYCDGYSLESDSQIDEKINEAARLARECGTAVLFCGLTDRAESEGYDRKNLKMPDSHIQLIQAVSAVCKNTVIVLQNGGMVDMSWRNDVKAILYTGLAGQCAGGAIADVLTGGQNPSGRMAETCPEKEEDCPSYLYFSNDTDNAVYNEGVFVGYRHYTSKKIKTAYPFGHGLSYTQFKYDDFNITTEKDIIEISLAVKNEGKCGGRDVIQLYTGYQSGSAKYPVRELKDFIKTKHLSPGESESITFKLPAADLGFYDETIQAIVQKPGIYHLEIAKSAEDIIKVFEIETKSSPLPQKFDRNTCIGDILTLGARGEELVREKLLNHLRIAIYGNFEIPVIFENGKTSDEMFNNIMKNMPLRALITLSRGEFTEHDINGIIEELRSKQKI